MVKRLAALFRRDDAVSQRWLKDQARQASRVEFHGVAIRWPIKKLVNDAGQFNRRRLRQSA